MCKTWDSIRIRYRIWIGIKKWKVGSGSTSKQYRSTTTLAITVRSLPFSFFLSSHNTMPQSMQSDGEGGGGESHFRRRDIHCVTLFVYVCTLSTTPHLLEDAELRKSPRHIQPDQLQGFLPGEGRGRPAPPPPAGGGGRRKGGRRSARRRLRLPGADQVLGSLHQDAVKLRRQVQLKEHEKESQKNIRVWSVLGIRDILVRIRIRGFVPLTNGSGSGFDSRSDSFLELL